MADAIKIAAADMELSPYDSADYLHNEADIKEYLQAATAGGGDDPAYRTRILNTIARARNRNRLAKKAGIKSQMVDR